MEIAFRERLQKELAVELAHGVSTSTPKKVMTVKLTEQEESSEKAISERRLPECNVEQERIGSVRSAVYRKRKRNTNKRTIGNAAGNGFGGKKSFFGENSETK